MRLFTRYMDPQRRALLLTILSGILVFAGCGKGKLAVHPVTGVVRVDGKPAPGAMVILCPVGGSDKLQRERPYGTADGEGKFTLTTFDKGDGAPAGEYKVLVQWMAPPKPGADRDRGEGSPDRLRGKYMNLANSQLHATVGSGATELPPFDLKTQ